jgi:DNA ligase (NAD+)
MLKVPKETNLAHSLEEVFQYIDYWDVHRHDLPYETDGVVVKVNHFQDNGLHLLNHRDAMAYKFKSEQVSNQAILFLSGKNW